MDGQVDCGIDAQSCNLWHIYIYVCNINYHVGVPIAGLCNRLGMSQAGVKYHFFPE